jgi:ornithine cyclodeaminase/alanine dehydrogenase-like protein (mu-crystallin family)
VFKSVGIAVEDVAAAKLVFEVMSKKDGSALRAGRGA